MISIFIQWVQGHTGLLVEVSGVICALVYLYFSIRQNIWLWPFGILTSAFYLYIFFFSRLYADMGLQVYYLIISVYGWYFWLFGGGQPAKNSLRVSRIQPKQALLLSFAAFLIFWVFVYALLKVPGLLDIPASEIPYWDAFTTAASIVATWMLARKILEHWLVWIVVDALSMGLYIYKGLYLTSGLFLIYTLLAAFGYLKWKKDFKNNLEGIRGL